MNVRPLALALALLLVACSSTRNKEPPPKPFAGTRWQFVLQAPLPGEAPYVLFGEGHLEGFGGCNHFMAGYVEDSVGAGAIAVRRIEMPERHMCDATAQAAESYLLDALKAASSFAITGNTLVLSGPGGTLRLHAVSAQDTYR
jgi:heat shock protein HslJ